MAANDGPGTMRLKDHARTRWLYIATVFASAALLFAVQPMFTKMVLPRLGGAPAAWSILFCLLIALIGACGVVSVRRRDGTVPEATQSAPPTWRDALVWTALAAVPAGLLVAVTAHISTDIGAVPLLWVVPLALYLL